MNKAERHRLEAAEVARLRVLVGSTAANPYAPEVAADIPKPTGGETAEGWLYIVHTREVYQAWSQPHAHGHGTREDRVVRHVTGSQGGRALWSTRARALRALRAAVELQFAEVLVKIDRQIAAEESR